MAFTSRACFPRTSRTCGLFLKPLRRRLPRARNRVGSQGRFFYRQVVRSPIDFTMELEHPTLSGQHVRLEPLTHAHISGLAAASSGDAALYQWSPVPRGEDEAKAYIDTALAWGKAGTAVSFAIVRSDNGKVVGSTRFFNVERWAWPQGHPRYGRRFPDACEIGYTWLAHSALRTATNTEAKLLMLTYAFETWEA